MSNNAIQTSGSLRKNLAVILIGGLTALTLLLYVVLRGYTTQIAQQSQDSILLASVSSILDAAVIRDGELQIDIPYTSFSMLNTETDDRIFYAVMQDNQLISGYNDLSIPEIPSDADSVFQFNTHLETAVRQVTASRVLVGSNIRTRITASIAQTQDNLSGTLNRISEHATVFGLAFLFLAFLLAALATSSTINPLKRLTDSVTRRGPHDLSPVQQPVPTEMVPLVASLNQLMARLEKSLKQSEDFIAEAAHRVQTPLATVRSHAEVTLQRVDKDENRYALRTMIHALDEASRAAGQLLDHAMITFRANSLEKLPFDLTETVRDVVLRIRPLAEIKDIELILNASRQMTVSGDIILIQNAVHNLIDNALKYSPRESTVIIDVLPDPSPTIIVKDQGPGFHTENVEELTERFSRGHSANGTIGSGLGLTIVRDVATAHGITLTFVNNSNGGACVIFSF